MEQISSTEEVDIAPLLSSAGVTSLNPVKITQIPGSTYELEAAPKDNWLYYALSGFQELKSRLSQESISADHLLIIGTGPGIDAIGATAIFRPDYVRVTDINRPATEIAHSNLSNNLPADLEVRTAYSVGDLLKLNLAWPDITEEVPSIDFVYGNLPNIPADDLDLDSSSVGTYMDPDSLRECPEELDNYLLALQHEFLLQVKDVLADDGSAVLALGARMPWSVIEELFAVTKFKLEELFTGFKIQTQAHAAISGYAEAEQDSDVTFSFYDYDKVHQSQVLQEGMTTFEMQIALADYELSATQALEFHEKGQKIGHIVSILRGVKS